MTRPPLDPEVLLSHAGFLRGLASHLVHGSDRADDVVQDVWLAATARPPEPRGGVGAWLARVARNVAAMRRRGDARRARREAAAARPEAGAPSTADVVAREEVRSRLVAAVLALEEPYRETVLLRWFEDLPPREVARRQGVPVETVRTRCKRAVVRLREALDERHGGERRRWAVALAGLAGPPPAPGGGGAGGLGPALLGGAAVVVLAVAFVPRWLGGGEADGPEPAAVAGGDAPAPARLAAGPERPAAGPALAAAPPVPDPRAARTRGTLRGVVVEADGRTPVPGASVRARGVGGTVPDGLGDAPPAGPAHDARADAAGAFAFPSLPLGAYELVATGAAGTARLLAAAASADEVVWVLRLEATPPRGLGVRVVSAAGELSAGARVARAVATGVEPVVVTTEADGVARFPGPEPERAVLTAESGPLAARVVRLARDSMRPLSRADEETLTLVPRGAIEGRLLAPSGAATAGIRVEAWFLTTPAVGSATVGVRHEAMAGPDGSFEIPGLPAGTYFLLVSGADDLALDLRRPDGEVDPRAAPSLPRVEVRPGETTRADVRLASGGALAGRVTREDGTPVVRARVEATLAVGDHQYERDGVRLWRLDARGSLETGHPLGHRVVATDDDGRYAFPGLLPSERWRVRVVAEGLAFDVRSRLRVVAGETTETTHRLAAAGTLEAVLEPKSQYALRREGVVVAAFVSPLGAVGAVTVPGLAAGRWELCETLATSLRPLVAFEVRAGETTWATPPPGEFVHEVAFRRDGAPLPGVRTFAVGEQSFARAAGDVRAFRLRSEPLPDEGPSFVAEGPEPDAVRLHVGSPPLAANGRQRWRGTIELPSGAVLVRCLDAAGAPAPGASLQLRGEGRTTREERDPWHPTLRGLQPRRSDGAGRASWSGVPEGRHRVSATFADGTRAEGVVDVESGRRAELELRSYVAGSLRATVLDERGTPARKIRVAVTAPGPAPEDDPRATWRGPLAFWNDALTDDAGTLVVAGLPPGTVRVIAMVPVTGPGARAPASSPQEVEIRAGGETPVTLRLEPPR